MVETCGTYACCISDPYDGLGHGICGITDSINGDSVIYNVVTGDGTTVPQDRVFDGTVLEGVEAAIFTLKKAYRIVQSPFSDSPFLNVQYPRQPSTNKISGFDTGGIYGLAFRLADDLKDEPAAYLRLTTALEFFMSKNFPSPSDMCVNGFLEGYFLPDLGSVGDNHAKTPIQKSPYVFYDFLRKKEKTYDI